MEIAFALLLSAAVIWFFGDVVIQLVLRAGLFALFLGAALLLHRWLVRVIDALGFGLDRRFVALTALALSLCAVIALRRVVCRRLGEEGLAGPVVADLSRSTVGFVLIGLLLVGLWSFLTGAGVEVSAFWLAMVSASAAVLDLLVPQSFVRIMPRSLVGDEARVGGRS